MSLPVSLCMIQQCTTSQAKKASYVICLIHRIPYHVSRRGHCSQNVPECSLHPLTSATPLPGQRRTFTDAGPRTPGLCRISAAQSMPDYLNKARFKINGTSWRSCWLRWPLRLAAEDFLLPNGAEENWFWCWLDQADGFVNFRSTTRRNDSALTVPTCLWFGY